MKPTHRAGATLRLISHEGMLAVEPQEVKLSFVHRLKVLCTGRIIAMVPKAHPEVVDLGNGSYFGHPETIKTFAQEIKEGQRPAQQRPQLHVHRPGHV